MEKSKLSKFGAWEISFGILGLVFLIIYIMGFIFNPVETLFWIIPTTIAEIIARAFVIYCWYNLFKSIRYVYK